MKKLLVLLVMMVVFVTGLAGCPREKGTKPTTPAGGGTTPAKPG